MSKSIKYSILVIFYIMLMVTIFINIPIIINNTDKKVICEREHVLTDEEIEILKQDIRIDCMQHGGDVQNNIIGTTCNTNGVQVRLY